MRILVRGDTIMRKCRKCKAEKSEDQFPEWGGKPGHVCNTCKGVKGGVSAKQGKKKKPKLTRAAAPPELELEFPAGYGFKAYTEGDAISIEQRDADGNPIVCMLSRAEFATIIAHFGEWSGEVGHD